MSNYRHVLFTGSRFFQRDPIGAQVAQRFLRHIVAREARKGLVRFGMGDAPGIDQWARYYGHRESVHCYVFALNGTIRLYSTDSIYLEVGSWEPASSIIDERPRPLQRDDAMVSWMASQANGDGCCYGIEHTLSQTKGTRATLRMWEKTELPFEHWMWDGGSLCRSPSNRLSP